MGATGIWIIFPTTGLDSNLRRKCRLIKKTKTKNLVRNFKSLEAGQRRIIRQRTVGRTGVQTSKRGWCREGKERNTPPQAPLVTMPLAVKRPGSRRGLVRQMPRDCGKISLRGKVGERMRMGSSGQEVRQ